MTGAALKPKLVREARKQDIDYFRKVKVYKKVPRSEATGKVISVRWVDINKGDEVNPHYRSRFVAREINTHANPEMFAATPPTEALKRMIAIAATKNAKGQKRRLMVNDVSRAYFYAKAIRKVCVDIAEEDRGPGDENMVG